MTPHQWIVAAIGGILFSLVLGYFGVMDTATVLQHIAFAIWTVFMLWYGFKVRWEDTPHGVNTFIVSAGLWLVLLAVEVATIWPGARWLAWLIIPIYLFLNIGGAQRLWFMIRRHRSGDDGGPEQALHPDRKM